MKTASGIRKVIAERVKGVWEEAHDKRGHHYRHVATGTIVDSVTTKIIIEKPHIVPWAVEIGIRDFISKMEFYDPQNEEQTLRMIESSKYAWQGNRDDAGNVGTASHLVYNKYMEYWIAEGRRLSDIRIFLTQDPSPINKDPRVCATLRAAEKFFLDHPGIIPVASELLVGDLMVGTAGTLDLLVLWEGKLWLLDFKTSNSPAHDDYAMQVAIYKRLFELMTGLKIHGASILGVSKSYDKYTLLDVVGPGKATVAFRGIAKAYDWRENGQKKLLERKNRVEL